VKQVVARDLPAVGRDGTTVFVGSYNNKVSALESGVVPDYNFDSSNNDFSAFSTSSAYHNYSNASYAYHDYSNVFASSSPFSSYAGRTLPQLEGI
jgi:hypothetical protein